MSGFGNQGPFELYSAINNVDFRNGDPASPPFDDTIMPGLFTDPSKEDLEKLAKLRQD